MRCRHCGLPYPPEQCVEKAQVDTETTGVCIQCLLDQRNSYRDTALELAEILNEVSEERKNALN